MGKINFFGLLFIGGLLYLMSSCLSGDYSAVEDWNMSNAQIASFALSSNEVDLSTVKFTIDQVNGKIYNKDSLTFGTVLEQKVIATVGYDNQYGAGGLFFVEQSTGDTVTSVSDSIDFSAPVMITVYALDGSSFKEYEAKLNIHQVNPDTMIWEKYADFLPGRTFQDMKIIPYNGYYYMYVVENAVYQLYRSHVQDWVNWEKLNLQGFPDHAILSQLVEFDQVLYIISEDGDLFYTEDGQEWVQAVCEVTVKSLLGSLPADTVSGRNAVLCCITEMEGVFRFVAIDQQFTCTTGQVVPETFPLSGFGSFNYETRYYPRLVVAGGRDANNNLSNRAWATMDGASWAPLSNAEATFTHREGAAFAWYDDCFFVIGGTGSDGACFKDIYFSKDQGVTWLYGNYFTETDDDGNEITYLQEIYPMHETYEPRGYSSVIIDKDHYILLFGGKASKDTNILNEVWRGRINRLGFGKE